MIWEKFTEVGLTGEHNTPQRHPNYELRFMIHLINNDMEDTNYITGINSTNEAQFWKISITKPQNSKLAV